MDEKRVMASTFKQRCLAMLDEVARTKIPLVVTKRGRPVARIVPLDEEHPRSTERSVTLIAAEDEAYFATGESWDAESGG